MRSIGRCWRRLGMAALSICAGLAAASPLRIVVPYPAGGATDTVARIVGEALAADLGQPVIVVNRPGASGTLGSSWFAQLPADEAALLLATVSTLTIAPQLQKVDYDAAHSFAPVGMIGVAPLYAVVPAASRVRSLRDLADAAAAAPDALSYASVGEGSIPAIVGQEFARLASATLLHVPYVSSQRARLDLSSGRVDLMFDQLATFGAHELASRERLRPLAVLSRQRQAALPDVPTSAEAGYGGLEAEFWAGLVAPRGTPGPRVRELNAALQRALNSGTVRQQLTRAGIESRPGSAADFARWIGSEQVRWAALLKAPGR